MKIGIVTYHRSHNYGALLQAVALRIVLESMGREVYYVDYWPGYHRRMYALINYKMLFNRRIGRAYDYLKLTLWTWRCKMQRRKVFIEFIRKHIEPHCKPIDEHFDIIIYGSDQIWRKQPEGVGYNPMYFGMNELKCNRHITYAASMGESPSDRKDADTIKALVAHLDRISVRETSLCDFLKPLGVEDISVCLDPTLLVTRTQWEQIFKPRKNGSGKYVLFYELQRGAFNLSEIKKFADIHNCELKVLHGYAIHKETENDTCTVSPEGFIDIIRNAEFVFTSSFHGLAFAIIFQKVFFTAFVWNIERAKSMLQQLDLENHLLAPCANIPINVTPIDYQTVENKMDVMRKNSLRYLAGI